MGRFVQREDQQSVVEQDFVGALGPVVRLEQIARGGVDLDQRPVELQRSVNPVSDGHQPLW